MACLEFLAVSAATFLGSQLYHASALHQAARPEVFAPASMVIAALALMISLGSGHFRRIHSQSKSKSVWNGLLSVVFGFSLFLTVLFLSKIADQYSRGTFVFQFIAAAAAVVGIRSLWYSRLRRAIVSGSIESRRAILIGAKSACDAIRERLTHTGIKVIWWAQFPNAKYTTTPSNLVLSERQIAATCRKLRPDDIIVLPSDSDPLCPAGLIECLSELPVDVHILPAGLASASAVQGSQLGPFVGIQLCRRPLSLVDRALKRALDLVIAAFLLAFLSPIMLMAAAAIVLDSRGPVFFRQKRHGYNNEPITVIKFRSMHVLEGGDNFTPARRNDDRVTRVGRVLRRTNIDELPQLINVLAGTMSIVGPRPHATAHNDMFEHALARFARRHNVKPGITGWAQINGCRGEANTLEKMRLRVDHDLYYIDNWSLFFDLKIIVLTALSKSVYLDGY
jgi:Undecaprenyl-phosphate glucose phosphotransferase